MTASDCLRTPWLGCAKHWPAMFDALHVGLPGATSGGAAVQLEVL